jgi:hypothetical protein
VVDPWREAPPVWMFALAVLAPMTRPESMGPHSMVSGSSSAPTGRSLEDDRARLTGTGFTKASQAQASRRLGQAAKLRSALPLRARGRCACSRTHAREAVRAHARRSLPPARLRR